VGPNGSGSCAAAEPTTPATFVTEADIVQKMGGTWRNCQTGMLSPGTVGGAGGFEVMGDGHFYSLGLDSMGNLVRMTGFDHEAVLVTVPQQTMPDLVYANGGFDPIEVSLSSDGTTLGIFSMAGSAGPYVATQESIVIPPTEPMNAHEGAAGCGTTEANILPAPTNQADAAARIVGRWTTCRSDSAFGPPGTVGLEFDGNGAWAFLVAAGGGPAAASTDPVYSGTYQFLSHPGFAGLTWQLNLSGSNGTWNFEFAESASPVKLQLMSESGEVVLSAN
jgi:hypothetical protein